MNLIDAILAADMAMHRHGVQSHTYLALLFIMVERPGIDTSRLAARLDRPQETIGVIVRVMEKCGLCAGERGASSRFPTKWTATPRGARLVADASTPPAHQRGPKPVLS